MKKYGKHILIGLLSGVLNGLFGSGGGCVVVPAMAKFLKIEDKKAHATAILIILLMSLVSSFLYIKNGFFDMGLWLKTSAGGVIGGAVGAAVLARISVRWLKIVFGSVIVVTAIKMIF